MNKTIFDIYGIPVLFGIFILLILLETKFQLRNRVQNRWKRVFINLILSIPAFMLLRLLFIPAVVWLSVKNQEWQLGLNYWFNAAPWIKYSLAFLLLRLQQLYMAYTIA